MIEILKNFLNLVAIVINKLFFMKIELSDNVDAYLGVLIISVVLFFLLMWFVFEVTGINNALNKLFGGDE